MNTITGAPAIPTAAPSSSLEVLLMELLHLSPTKKLEVIARLAQSLQEAEVAQQPKLFLPKHRCPPSSVPGPTNRRPMKWRMPSLSIRSASSEPKLN